MKINPENIDQLFQQAAQQNQVEPPAEMMQRVLDQWQQMGGGSTSQAVEKGADVQAQTNGAASNVAGLAKGKIAGGLSLSKAIVAAVVVAGVSAAVWMGVNSDNGITPLRQNGVAGTEQGIAADASAKELTSEQQEYDVVVADDMRKAGNTAVAESPEKLNAAGEHTVGGNQSHGKLSEKLDVNMNGSGRNAVEVNAVEAGSVGDKATDIVSKAGVKSTTLAPKVVVSKPLEFEISLSDKAYVVRVEKRWEDSGELRIDWGLGQGFSVQKSREIFVQRSVKLRVLVQIVRNGKLVKSGEEILVVDPHGDATEILVPEIITRNGDGLNDEFYVSMPQPEYFEVMVMDKVNRVVFRSNDTEARWNGLKNGMKVEAGEYAVMVAYRYSNQKKINYVRQILIVQD